MQGDELMDIFRGREEAAIHVYDSALSKGLITPPVPKSRI